MSYYDHSRDDLAGDFGRLNVRGDDQHYYAKQGYGHDQGRTRDYSDRPASPVYSPPSDKPPIPAGWDPHFDQQYQRWYYFERETGRSQWEAPGYTPPRPPMPGSDRAYEGGYGGYHGGGGEYGSYGGGEEKRKESSGLGKTMLAGAGGAAIGMVGGALLANALDGDSDEEHHHYAPPPPVAQPDVQQYQDVDSSDAESLREAQEDYNEALEAARDSDASSSEEEELEEAREEYIEEYEEAYDDE